MRPASVLSLAALLLAAPPAPGFPPASAPTRLHVRPGDSDVGFTISKWSVLTVTGRFRDVSGEVHLDPDRPEASRVTVKVRVASLSTGDAARDLTLQSEDFFDAARYPAMTFVSSAVSLLPDGRASVTGDLTIRGVTRRITVPVTVHGPTVDADAGTIAGFEIVFPIDRRDYGVHGSRWSGGRAILGTQVRVRMLVSASASQPR